MDYKEYEQMVVSSERGSLTDYSKVLHAMMGMNGEAGECIDILKKHLFQGHELDVDHLLSELGDVCWYTVLLIHELNIEVEYVFDYIDKLIHVKQWKEKPIEKGIGYIFNINACCGRIIDIYYDSVGDPKTTILGTLRFIFWNVRMTANMFDKTLEDIFDINHQKIKKRYPDGFNTNNSINRESNIPIDKFPIMDVNNEIKGIYVMSNDNYIIRNASGCADPTMDTMFKRECEQKKKAKEDYKYYKMKQEIKVLLERNGYILEGPSIISNTSAEQFIIQKVEEFKQSKSKEFDLPSLRTCLIRPQRLKKDSLTRKAYFHRLCEKYNTSMVDNKNGMHINGCNYTVGLVEYEDGTMDEVHPRNIKFTDKEC